MWAQIISLALGIWLLIAPDVFGYGDPARSVERVIGPVVIVVAALALRGVTRPTRHLNILTGLGLLIAPWLFTYVSIPAIANSALIGMAVMGLALVRGRVSHQYGGGWLALWQSEKLALGMREEQIQRASARQGSADITRAS
jgi:hypothetical protein